MKTVLWALLAAGVAWGDAGVLVPAGRDQPDPSIFSLNEMTVEIRIDNGIARVGDDWFAGTYGAGVMRLDSSGHWAAMTPAFEVNPNAMVDAGGALYVGSLGKGLWVYSGRWRNVTAGLPSLNVTAVAVGNGFVYAGTDNGLVRFREGDLR